MRASWRLKCSAGLTTSRCELEFAKCTSGNNFRQDIGAHPPGNQTNTPSRFVNEGKMRETAIRKYRASGETLENEIVDPRFCDCVVFGAWRHCQRGIDAGARDLLLAERKVRAPRRVEWSPPPRRRLRC